MASVQSCKYRNWDKNRYASRRGRRRHFGVIIQLEYLIAEYESKEKFILVEIRTKRIQQIERLISKADGGATLEFDFWRQEDGKQELRSAYRILCQCSDSTVGQEQRGIAWLK